MPSFLFRSAVLAAAAIAGSPMARADFDALPYVKDGKLITGAHDDDAGTNIANQRVFDYVLGEVAPYHAGDPGFNNQGVASVIASFGGAAFSPNSYLYATALPQNAWGGRYLSYWSGTGSASFGAAPAGVTLALTGGTSMVYSDAAASGSPLAIGRFNASGTIHEHLATDLLLNGAGATTGIPDGFYVVALQLYNPSLPSTAGSSIVAPSDTLYYLFVNGFDEEASQYEAALGSVNAVASVPEPGALATMLPALTLLRRARRLPARRWPAPRWPARRTSILTA